MITAIWGLEKSCKTTLGLTWPKPLKHFDFDLGYERASHRFKGQDIASSKHITPIQLGARLYGCKELWYKFITDYNKTLEDKSTATVMVDTATQLWEVCRMAYLQEKQENQAPNERLRQSLIPVEYAEPNARMKSIIQAARQHDKHLVLIHYARDEYITRQDPDTGQLKDVRSGKLEIDGFKWTEGLVDLVVHTYIQRTLDKRGDTTGMAPWGVITLSGLDLGMVGQKFEAPNYDSFITLFKMLRGEE